ncbi:MAG: hypothetical protein JWP85_1638 [Rhodoglobus sp.]|nr:hypothetical protein [Rhodoglobus sp.]
MVDSSQKTHLLDRQGATIEHDGSRKYSAPAAGCAGEILLALAEAGDALTLTELERGIGRSKTLVFRALRELEQLQLVARVGDHRYRLGLAAFEVGAAFLTQGQIDDSIRTTLRDLADESGESTNLGVLRGSEVLYLMKYEGHGAYVTLSRVGGRVPATCTAIGKALLSTLSSDELHAIVHDPLPQMTPASISRMTELEVNLAETRERGYAVDMGEAVPGRGGLAVTIPFLGHEAKYAAISLSTVLERVGERHDEHLLGLLLEARERIVREVETRRALVGDR